MPFSLTHLFRSTLEDLEGLEAGVNSPAAKRATRILSRDLVPRTIGEEPCLVVGIVGPNNAGKSALFNHLVGKELSASKPQGGLTRRLFGAAQKDVLQLLTNAPSLQRFPMTLGHEEDAVEATRTGTSPDDLFALESAQVPSGLLLIDTPDFDSMVVENREVSESMFSLADLLIVVVTRHSYQNRDVVHFLQKWLHHGRPWVAVYNEAGNDEEDVQNLRKLSRDIGSDPVAAFRSAYNPQKPFGDGPASLHFSVEDMEEAISDQVWRGSRLDQGLHALSRRRALKSRALYASANLLRDDLEELAAELASQAAHAEELLQDARLRTQEAGQRAANGAVPLWPIMNALAQAASHDENDRLQGLSRSFLAFRVGVRRIMARLAWGRRAVRRPCEVTPKAAARSEFTSSWGTRWNALVHALGKRAESPVREATSVAWAELLDQDLQQKHEATAGERARSALRLDPTVAKEFQRSCNTIAKECWQEIGPLSEELVFCTGEVRRRSPLFALSGFDDGLGSPTPEQCDPLTIQQARTLIASPTFLRFKESWANLQGEWFTEQILSAALPRTYPKLVTVNKREFETAAHLRSTGANIEIALQEMALI